MCVSRWPERNEVESSACTVYAANRQVSMRLSRFLILVRVCQIICPQQLEPTPHAVSPKGKSFTSGYVWYSPIGRTP